MYRNSFLAYASTPDNMQQPALDDLADYESDEENLNVGESDAADQSKKYRNVFANIYLQLKGYPHCCPTKWFC